MAAASPPRLTIAIMALNEARHIGPCVRSAAFADQVLVLDGGSTDDTVKIAQAEGAEVHVASDWKGFAEQRNRQLQHVQGDYVFFLDADEEIPDELATELCGIVASGASGYWEVKWLQVAFGRPLHRMDSTAVKRLFRRDDLLGFEGVVHERPMLNKPMEPRVLRARLTHHSMETVHASLIKIAQYAQLGAVKRYRTGRVGGIWRGGLSAITNFVRFYVLRRGFLCGSQGFLYCLFLSLECFFRYVALRYDREHLEILAKR